MNQEQMLLQLFRVVLVADLVALASFIVLYTMLAAWWRNTIGRTIVIKDLLLGAALTPSVLSLFFHFSRLTSRVAGWVDVGLFAGIAVTMVWRDIVWWHVHHDKKSALTQPEDPPAGSLGTRTRRALHALRRRRLGRLLPRRGSAPSACCGR